jgi:hypothetical protein
MGMRRLLIGGMVLLGLVAVLIGAAEPATSSTAKTIPIRVISQLMDIPDTVDQAQTPVFSPAAFNAVDGDILEFCNRTKVIVKLFSLSTHNRFGEPRGLRLAPAQCASVTLHNPTGKPIVVGISDEIHSRAKLLATVLPRGSSAPLDPKYIPAATPNPPGGRQPTELTLTVNGRSDTATTAKPTNDDPKPLLLPSGKELDIEATADIQMPKGWTLRIWRTGDPLSAGNGNYYLVCEEKGQGTFGEGASSCHNKRPGLDATEGDRQDVVYATITAPTYLARNVQIKNTFQKPK